MVVIPRAGLRIAVVSPSPVRRHRLVRLVEGQGFEVVARLTLFPGATASLEKGMADAVLLDLNGAAAEEIPVVEDLLGLDVPVLFSDGSFGGTRGAGRHAQVLLGKLKTAALRLSSIGTAPRATSDMAGSSALALPWEEEAPPNAWVLGASHGGPEALKRFLAALSSDVPLALVIGQHIGAGFVPRLARQLSRASQWSVEPAASGATLTAGEVVLAPVEARLVLDRAGRIAVLPDLPGNRYHPSIDALMETVAKAYGPRSGAIIFSGMGEDGTRGARAIVEAGGVVWAQDAADCASPAMPNSARRAGTVSRSGSADALATALARHLTRP